MFPATVTLSRSSVRPRHLRTTVCTPFLRPTLTQPNRVRLPPPKSPPPASLLVVGHRNGSYPTPAGVIRLFDEVVGSPDALRDFLGLAATGSEHPFAVVVHKAHSAAVTEFLAALAAAKDLNTFPPLRKRRRRPRPDHRLSAGLGGLGVPRHSRHQLQRRMDAATTAAIRTVDLSFRLAKLKRVRDLLLSSWRVAPKLHSAVLSAESSGHPIDAWPASGIDTAGHPADTDTPWDASLLPAGTVVDLAAGEMTPSILAKLASLYTTLCPDPASALKGHRRKVRLTVAAGGNRVASSYLGGTCSVQDAQAVTNVLAAKLSTSPGTYPVFPFCLPRPTNDMLTANPGLVVEAVEVAVEISRLPQQAPPPSP